MTKKRIATLATCIALVGTVAVGGTLALLSSNTATLTNTFTIGSGYPDQALTLDEDKVAQVTTGTKNFGGYEAIVGAGADRVAGQAYNNLVADTTLDKDPTFHLAAESPDSWIIAKVTGVDALADKGITINGELSDYGWLKLDTATGTATPITSYDELVDGYYVTTTTIAAGASTDALFEELKVGTDVNRDAALDSIVVSGVAVEAVTGTWAQDGAAVVAQAKTAGFIPAE